MPATPAEGDSFKEFYASMPSRYRELFDASTAGEHAAIVARRDGQPAHVELWRRIEGSTSVVCVVADDRPGLLSLISAALVAHGMDVVAVQAYTRRSRQSDTPEAVDLFWLRREAAVPRSEPAPSPAPLTSSPILASDITRVGEALRGLVVGTLSVEELLRDSRAVPARPQNATTRVTFDEDPATRNVVLTVETYDRPGLLLAVTRALFRAGVQILGSEATTKDSRVVDRFTIVERNGGPIQSQRRGLLQMEVLSAIESLVLRPK